jgi:hypothetical protein
VSTTRVAPKAVFVTTMPGCASTHSPITAASAPSVSARVVPGHDREQLALVRDVQRIESEERAGVPDRLRHRQRALDQLDADPGRLRDLVQRGRHATPGRIAQDVQIRAGGEHRRHQPVQRGAVADHLGAERDPLAHAHDRDPVDADLAADDDDVTGSRPLWADVNAGRDQPDAGGVDVHAITMAGVDDLGVAGRDRDARPARGSPEVCRDPADHRQLDTLLENEAAGQVRRLRAAHREVVDRAVDGEVPDAAAREEQRLHDERVGRERQPRLAQREHRRVRQALEHRVGERRQEEVLDQLARHLSAAPVAHHDRRVIA